jgi:hypothetical protein
VSINAFASKIACGFACNCRKVFVVFDNRYANRFVLTIEAFVPALALAFVPATMGPAPTASFAAGTTLGATAGPAGDRTYHHTPPAASRHNPAKIPNRLFIDCLLFTLTSVAV